ncbi:MAG: SAVED domain-containing protein [Coleofasciculaceae cyanobacterium SM2_1_6]|nr:SAVED domain-containing protein [Coleofasciculaceae cyanobacterium SM2_1_6]
MKPETNGLDRPAPQSLSSRPTPARLKRFLQELPDNLNTPWTSISSLLAGFVGLYPGIPDLWRLGLIGGLVAIVLAGAWHKWSEQRKYRKTAIAIPFVINVANSADTIDALHKLFTVIERDFDLKDHLQNLQTHLHIQEEDLYLKYGSGVPDELYDIDRFLRFLAVLQEKIDRLERLALNDMTLCIAYIGPASAAIAIGTFLTHSRVVFYHLDRNTNDKYYPVMTSSRKLKETLNNLEKFEMAAYDSAGNNLTIPLNTPLVTARQLPVTLAIDAASHKISLSESSIKSFGDIVHLKSRSGGTIELEEDWGLYCQEIFNVLNNIQSYYGQQEIRLVYSMPVILGMALGTVLQSYWNITITQYEKSSYRDFINLQKIPKPL